MRGTSIPMSHQGAVRGPPVLCTRILRLRTIIRMITAHQCLNGVIHPTRAADIVLHRNMRILLSPLSKTHPRRSCLPRHLSRAVHPARVNNTVMHRATVTLLDPLVFHHCRLHLVRDRLFRHQACLPSHRVHLPLRINPAPPALLHRS